MWPPPPPPPLPPGTSSAADPFQRPPPPAPPPPFNHSWPYSAPQFHYHPQTQHSPSPPAQWPLLHSSDHAQYPPHPPPYSAHQPPPYTSHPPYPRAHQLPPRPTHVPQSYSQDWGSGSWSRHQSWQYPTNNNEEDWAAKARAWAAAKSATDNQHTPSQFIPAGRPVEQSHFHDQYSQPVDPQFLDVHTPVAPTSNYHQHPDAVALSNSTVVGQLQDSQYMSSEQSSYAADVHAPFAARDGSMAADSVPPFQQEKSPISPLVQQQEVPSSYSSVAGNVEAGDRYENFNSSSSVSVPPLPQHHYQQGGSEWIDEPHHLRGSQPPASVTDPSDQPLNFAPHFNRDRDAHVQTNYAHASGGPARSGDPIVGMSSNYSWAPSSAPATAYHPISPKMPSGPQVDHPIAMPSPASAPMFPPGPGFQPTVPMTGAAFGVGVGVTPHPTAFPGDAYGAAERPKKASVPNWLREEIIKNKAVIPRSGPDLPKEDSQSIEDENNDKSSRKGEQADSKSIESSRSTEDEDEDEVEAARTAAINKEIKRVLTEVLLKVTDELFDELATKVLKEDDLSVEVGHDADLSNLQALPSAPSAFTPKASAKVLIPAKTMENDYEDASDKSTSGSPGDVLGLASYASDEEDEDMQSSGKPNSKESSKHLQSSSSQLLEGNLIGNGSLDETEEQGNVPSKLETNKSGRKSPVTATSDGSVAIVDSNDNMPAKEITSTDYQHSSKRLTGNSENELQRASITSRISNSLIEKAVEKNELPDGNLRSKRWMAGDAGMQNIGDRPDKNDRIENKKSSIKKDHKDSESSKGRLDKRGDEELRRREERHSRIGRSEHYDNSKDKGKEKGRTDEKVKDSESSKHSSPFHDTEGTTVGQRDRRTISKKDNDGKRKDRAGDEKKEQSRHKNGSESSRNRRRRSSSFGPRDREGKDNPVPSRVNDSSDESLDDSKRKSHHSTRHRSPSPIRRRKRQVSRSPHSKHSKRRHSPSSSLETTRGRRSPSRSRSRSRSPLYRRRKP